MFCEYPPDMTPPALLLPPNQHGSKVFTPLSLWDLISIVFPAGDFFGLFQASESIWEKIKESGRKGLKKKKSVRSSSLATKYLSTITCQEIYLNQQNFPGVD